MSPTEVRPQTFAVLQQPDSDSPSVRCLAKRLSTCCLDILPVRAYRQKLLMGETPKTALLRFSEQNPRSPVFKVHRTYCLVFAFGYKIIIQYPKALVSKDYGSKMPTYYAVNGGVSDP